MLYIVVSKIEVMLYHAQVMPCDKITFL